MADDLRLVIRTPEAVVFDSPTHSVRVLTETGHVGLRPNMEAVVLAVEAGLVVIRNDGRVRFAGSAGGLLACDGKTATLYTPLGVVADDPSAVRAALDAALAEPGAELKLREALARLEGRILAELRRRGGDRREAATPGGRSPR